jgi:hypothetical protein
MNHKDSNLQESKIESDSHNQFDWTFTVHKSILTHSMIISQISDNLCL